MLIEIKEKVLTDQRYKKFVQLVGALKGVKIAPLELRILDEIYWTANGKLTTENRKLVCHGLQITEYTLNNYLIKLRRKGFVVGNDLAETMMIDLSPVDRAFGIHFILES